MGSLEYYYFVILITYSENPRSFLKTYRGHPLAATQFVSSESHSALQRHRETQMTHPVLSHTQRESRYTTRHFTLVPCPLKEPEKRFSQHTAKPVESLLRTELRATPVNDLSTISASSTRVDRSIYKPDPTRESRFEGERVAW